MGMQPQLSRRQRQGSAQPSPSADTESAHFIGDGCAARLETLAQYKCDGSKSECSEASVPHNFTNLCPADKIQDAYHIEKAGACTQVCLPRGLRNVAYKHGVRYGLHCVSETPRNMCTRFAIAGKRAGVHYYTFYCLEPCSAKEQACNGPTGDEYAGQAMRGPSRPRWSGDWWPGVPENELERQEDVCNARKGKQSAVQ